MSTNLTIKDLFDAGVQWGHSSRWRHPEMTPYVWGKHQGIDIIDLRKTLPMFQKSIDFAVRIVENRGKIVVVGTKRSAQQLVAKYAKEAGMPYVNLRWLGGTLTNFKTIKQSVKKLGYLESMFENSMFDEATKKERLIQERKMKKLEGALGGLRDMNTLPDALFVLDANHEKTAVLEANKLGIPVIAVVDSNTSIDGIQYMIPGNDDSQKVLNFYLYQFAQHVGAARAKVAQAQSTSGVSTTSNMTKKTAAKPAATKSSAKKAAADKPAEATAATAPKADAEKTSSQTKKVVTVEAAVKVSSKESTE